MDKSLKSCRKSRQEDNTGSGGGGSSGANRFGGDGGSGVIYLKYIAPESLFTYTGTQTVNSYIVSSGGGTKKYWPSRGCWT